MVVGRVAVGGGRGVGELSHNDSWKKGKRKHMKTTESSIMDCWERHSD